ncbi:hypothetical protein SANTM175S_09820 [Streptomyces antimycoticus]
MGWSKTSAGASGESGGGGELIAQLDRGEGVEAQLLEGLRRGNCVQAGVAEDRRGERLDMADEDLVPLCGRRRGEPLAERVVVGGVRGRGGSLGGAGGVSRVEERTGALRGEGRREPRPVDVRDGDGGVVVGQGVVQRRDGEFGGERRQTAPAVRCDERVLVGGHACVTPGAPGEAGGGQAPGVAVLGEGVEIGVRGGVGGLVVRCPRWRRRREENEGVRIEVLR